ncbi:MAG: respiratory nitrate reductase subunit gamma [Syntrophobacteraceae bacterium]
MQTLYYLVLVPMVYVAFAVFVIGTASRLVHIVRLPVYAATLQIFPKKGPGWILAIYDSFTLPTVRKHNPLLWVFLMLFHLCFFLLVIGHIELIAKIDALQVIGHEVFIGRGLVGLVLALALLFFLFRRFVSPNRDLSVPEDYYLLILLFLTVIFGSEMDWARRWYDYSEMTVQDYRAYLFSLLMLKPVLPAAITGSGHSFMLVLHVFFANLFLMFFPFSKIMHAFAALPINKLRRG